MRKREPKWLLALYHYYHASIRGEWLSNEKMSRLMSGGYYARNHLASNGDITKRGIGHNYRDVTIEGSHFRLYRLKLDSLEQAAKILTAHGMMRD